jgi:hypothetical protein
MNNGIAAGSLSRLADTLLAVPDALSPGKMYWWRQAKKGRKHPRWIMSITS